jgi:hypothetical protein
MKQALEMALEALESAEPKYTKQRADQKTLGGSLDYWKLSQDQRLKATNAIKEALAQLEQEPDVSHKLKFDCEFVDGTCADLTVYGSERDIKRLEARVKFWWNLEQHSGTPDSDKAERIRLGKPPQRTWVGLTDEEIEQLHTAWVLGGSFRKLCNSIEAKLKEKNT